MVETRAGFKHRRHRCVPGDLHHNYNYCIEYGVEVESRLKRKTNVCLTPLNFIDELEGALTERLQAYELNDTSFGFLNKLDMLSNDEVLSASKTLKLTSEPPLTAGQAGCLQGQDCSVVFHPSSSHALHCLIRLSCEINYLEDIKIVN
ncbi:hypothetical protein J6590_061100 [Homalodisca vitripennis]|nr:hypothetical protein J6590_061100 [Homalodisca vitripennis]